MLYSIGTGCLTWFFHQCMLWNWPLPFIHRGNPITRGSFRSSECERVKPFSVALTVAEGNKVNRKQNLLESFSLVNSTVWFQSQLAWPSFMTREVQKTRNSTNHSLVRWYEKGKIFEMVKYVGEMTAEESCIHRKDGLFELLSFFFLCVFFCFLLIQATLWI